MSTEIQKYDHTDYVVDQISARSGKRRNLVKDLTGDEARDLVCSQMETIERLRDICDGFVFKINKELTEQNFGKL